MSVRTIFRWLPAASLASALGLAACGSGGPVASDQFDDMGADAVLMNIVTNVTTDGIRRAQIIGDTAYVYDDENRVRLAVARVTLYDEHGIETGSLTSRWGEINTRTDFMTAEGDVVLVSLRGGQRIETEKLFFDPGVDRIWSDVPTTLHEDGSTIHGEGFTADGSLTEVRVTRPRGTATAPRPCASWWRAPGRMRLAT
jgi:LPS export ABC transporter protein LptC